MIDKIDQYLVDGLNRLLELDRSVMENLVSHRVPANTAVQDDPYFVVTKKNEIGLIGVLNGFSTKNGGKRIAAEYNEVGNIEKFFLIDTPEYP